jgi:peptidoglycan/LPS O-acetylase OafA/YrhL
VSEVTAGLPSGAFPLMHLWFLYYLLVLYALVLLCRGLIVRLDWPGSLRGASDAIVRGAIRSGTAPVLLALPVSLALYARDDWFIWFGIPTPDVSLVPELTSVAAFGTAMVFGWLVHRQRHVIDSWRDQWPVHLLAALGATTMCLWIAGLAPSLVPEPPGVRKLAFAVCYSLAIWTWTFAIVGLALRFLSEHNPRVRYVADASYWIYIVHLPVVAAIQVLVGDLQWHWSLKLPLIVAGSLCVLFLSYDLMVRPTVIGQLLNGRKYPRRLRSSPDARLASAIRMPR